jgi:hypothetical protein
MKIGSIIAYDCDPAKLGEVMETFFYPSGELGLLVKPFDNSCTFCPQYASQCWLLADNL